MVVKRMMIREILALSYHLRVEQRMATRSFKRVMKVEKRREWMRINTTQFTASNCDL